MRFNYDKKADALYIRFDENPYAESDEIQEGVIFDYDKDKNIIGIEVLDASKKFSKKFQASLQKHKLPLSIEMKAAR